MYQGGEAYCILFWYAEKIVFNKIVVLNTPPFFLQLLVENATGPPDRKSDFASKVGLKFTLT